MTPHGKHGPFGRRSLLWPATIVGLALVVTGCATAPLKTRGNFAAQDQLVDVKGPRTKARIHFDAVGLAKVRTARIVPVEFASETDVAQLTTEQKALLAAAFNRTLCERVARRFDIVVASDAPADLTITSTITFVEKTGGGLAAASIVASRLSPIPFTPRLPIGMGALAGEAQAVDASGKPLATMLWARGADAFTTNARVSSIGDAYELSAAFGKDFGRMVITRSDPFKSAPKRDYEERKKDDPQCAVFGEAPGVAGFIGKTLGAPPEWADKGAAKTEPPKPGS